MRVNGVFSIRLFHNQPCRISITLKNLLPEPVAVQALQPLLEGPVTLDGASPLVTLSPGEQRTVAMPATAKASATATAQAAQLVAVRMQCAGIDSQHACARCTSAACLH